MLTHKELAEARARASKKVPARHCELVFAHGMHDPKVKFEISNCKAGSLNGTGRNAESDLIRIQTRIIFSKPNNFEL